MDEISLENLQNIDLKKLALNKDFGRLVFEKAHPIIEKTRDLLNELHALSYRDNLTDDEVNNIDSRKQQFVEKLNVLRVFDIGQENSQIQHDNLEQDVINFSHQLQQHLRNPVLWLREEVARKSQDTQELDKQQKMAAQAEKKYKQLSEKMKKELETLQNQRSEVASVQGEIAALRFGKHFEATTEKYENIAEKRWYVFGKLSFIVLFGVVIINLIAYIVLFVGEKLKWWPLKPTEFFTLEYGLVKLALLLLIIIGSATSFYLWTMRLSAVFDPSNRWFYLSKDEEAVVRYLSSNSKPGSGVMASYPLSNHIPAHTTNRVYFGHHFQTPKSEVRNGEQAAILSAAAGSTEVEKFLAENNVSAIVLEKNEASNEELHSLVNYEFLELVFENDSLVIYSPE